MNLVASTRSFCRPLSGTMACCAVFSILVTAACSSDKSTPGSDGGPTSTGGTPTASGGTTSGSGGAPSSGGTTATASGGTTTGSGGTTADGGPDSGPTTPAPVSLKIKQTNLVANQASAGATTVDPNLLNPWGIAIGPTGALWISDNHSGLATVYSATGTNINLNVTVPAPTGDTDPAAPSGQVFSGTATNFMGDKFIIDTEDGTISGWQSGTAAVMRVDNSAHAGYKGLEIVTNGAATLLLGANFHEGTVDVFDSTYAPVTTPSFKDTTLPDGYAPFNIAQISGKVVIAYALQDAQKGDDNAGVGHGYIDVFNTDGTGMKRLVSGGALNSPWGLALAPASYGALAGKLLVGNFGDGLVNAYDLTTGALAGVLADSTGAPLAIQGLWALTFGPKTATTDLTGTLFFTAGPGAEANGLLGTLTLP
jgi:uncharacterized protein (TIGR03118 family)